MASAFSLDAWRASTKERREIFRRLILESVTGNKSINIYIDQLKSATYFSMMSDADQNSFNVAASQARMIAENWNYIDDASKRQFTAGIIAPSGLARIAKKAVS